MNGAVNKGRGAAINPASRFLTVCQEDDFSQLTQHDNKAPSTERVNTTYFPDASQGVITQNNSPDIPFRYSLNPYRGCSHGCSYCYARATHEYLGLSAGLDFESKIMVKTRAPTLFRKWLSRAAWKSETICFSGVTDCYQPIERQYGLTRGCLEVALEARQAVSIVTKNGLVQRDLDLLGPMAERNLVSVALSITTLDAALARRMEPRTSAPESRLRAVAALRAAGVPTQVMVAPVIPGLNDQEIPAILAAAAEAGAQAVNYTLVRLAAPVRPVFLEWLARHEPDRRARIESLICSTRGGKLNDPRFGSRMRGEGVYAQQIKRTFQVFARRHGLDGRMPALDCSQFRPPRPATGQRSLFETIDD